jgi:hypothetical protein
MFKSLAALFTGLIIAISASSKTLDELTVGSFEFVSTAEVFVSPDGGFANNFLLEVGGRNATFGSTQVVVYSLEIVYSQPPAGWLYSAELGSNPALGKLFTVSGVPTNPVESGALQLAVWSVVGNLPGTVVDDLDGSWALAQTWLAQVQQTTALTEYTFFDNKNYNQYISLSPIPEPGTIALLLAGLGAIAVKARRRS